MSDVIDMLKKIRLGLVLANWNLVCEGYNEITGENIKPPEPKTPLEQLIDLRKRGKLELSDPDEDKYETTLIDQDGDPSIKMSEPPRQMKSNEWWDGKKIRRKKKDNIYRTSDGHPVGIIAEEVKQKVTTDLSIVDNTHFARGKGGGRVKADNPVFIDAAALFKKDPKFAKEIRMNPQEEQQEHEKLKQSHNRFARPPQEFYEVECVKCRKKEKVPASLLPTKVGEESEAPRYRCRACAGKPL